MAKNPAGAPKPMFDSVEMFRICGLLILALFVIVPMEVTLLGGFKSMGELRTNPFGLPNEWEFEHFGGIISDPAIWNLMFNSLKIAGLTVFLALLIGAMTAYCFSHIRFFGERFIFNYLLMGMMFPAAAGILPLFIKVKDMGLLDTHWGVIVPQISFGLGFSVLLFRTFFEQLPKELFDAALVDGCSYFRFFFAIVLPLSTPIIATVGVFMLVGSWNNYLLPLIVLNDPDLYPWTLGIMQFRGEYGIAWNKILAYISITITPAIIFFLLAQKYIVAGLTGGAVKG